MDASFLFGDQFKFKNRFIGKKIYLNVIAKFNLVTNYPSLTWPSAICASKEGRQVVNFVPRKKLNWRGVSLFVDDYIKYSTNDSLRSDFNVALLIESKAIKTYHYQMLAEHHNNFDLIMTHDIDIYKKFISKAVFIPADTVSLRDDSWGMHHNSKNKILSHLFSDKKNTSGHRLRHSVSQLLSHKYPGLCDQFGLGVGKFVENKHETLVNYMFAFAIENTRYDFYFTEKLLDCFISGTIPIYWGPPSITKFFDIRGVLSFSDSNQLQMILSQIQKDPINLYQKLYPWALINYQLSLNYLYLDDLIVYSILNMLDTSNRFDALLPYLIDPQDHLADLSFKYK